MKLSPMQWELHSITEFPKYSRHWNALADRLNAPPFLDARFIQRAIESFSQGDELLAIKGSNDNPDAMCLLRRISSTTWQTFQPAQLSVGCWLMAPGLTFETAIEGLFQKLPGLTLAIGISQQDPALYQRPETTGSIEAVDYKEIGWIPIEGDFESFWKARSKKFRQNYRTQRSRLAADDIETSMTEITDPTEVAGVVEEYSKLESAGWKGQEGTAVTVNSKQGQFYKAIFEDFCKSGEARMFCFRFNGKIVAIDLCLEYRDAQILLKTAFDESIKGISPSVLLKYEEYQQVFADPRLQRVEFFGPYMAWTSRWTKHTRIMYHVTTFRHPLIRLLRSLIHKLRAQSNG